MLWRAGSRIGMGHLYISVGPVLWACAGSRGYPAAPLHPSSEHQRTFLQPVMPTQPELLPFMFPEPFPFSAPQSLPRCPDCWLVAVLSAEWMFMPGRLRALCSCYVVQSHAIPPAGHCGGSRQAVVLGAQTLQSDCPGWTLALPLN